MWGSHVSYFFWCKQDIISLSIDIILRSIGPIWTLGFLNKCFLLNTECISVLQSCESVVLFRHWTDILNGEYWSMIMPWCHICAKKWRKKLIFVYANEVRLRVFCLLSLFFSSYNKSDIALILKNIPLGARQYRPHSQARSGNIASALGAYFTISHLNNKLPSNQEHE